MNKEHWKAVVGYEGLYEVSNFGRVKSLSRKVINNSGFRFLEERVLKPGRGSTGYETVFLYRDNKGKTMAVHSLVAIAFLNHTPCGYKIVIDHINDIKTDNRVENLQLVSQRFNSNKTPKDIYTSQYKGVSWNKNKKKWASYIKINGKNKYLGLFSSEIEASNVYQQALKDYNYG